MDFLGLLTDSALIAGITTVIGSIITYLVTKSNNRKDIDISDRVQLSKDQYQLIAELRGMMQEQKTEIDELREGVKQLTSVNTELIIKNGDLQSQLTDLMSENKDLQSQLKRFNQRLSKLDSDESA